MKSNLKIATIQTNLYWEDKEKNFENFNRLIDKIYNVDIILLPEMFNTGFSINPDLAEGMGGESIKFLVKKSKEKCVAIMATLMIKDKDKIYNRLVCVESRPIHSSILTTVYVYDKKHLFCLSDECKLLEKGIENNIIDIKGWKIMPQICYDIRFPVWSRNELINDEFKYDVLVYLANWPATRSHHWSTLLRARAIENQSYVVGVNRIGKDGRDIDHNGGTSIIDFNGETMYMSNNIEDINIKELNYESLVKFREILPVSKDWDTFEIKQ
jgi:omega-amidase